VDVFADHTASDTYRGILDDIEAGRITRIAYVRPKQPSWPLPLYDLALLTAQRARAVAETRAADVELLMSNHEQLKKQMEDTFAASAQRALKLVGESLVHMNKQQVDGSLDTKKAEIEIAKDQIRTIVKTFKNKLFTVADEVATDPSFEGQLVCFTAPMVGNYGTAAVRSESNRSHAKGVLMREARGPQCTDWLHEHGVVALTGVDTRSLVLHLRDRGAMRAAVVSEARDTDEVLAAVRAQPAMAGWNA